MRTRRIGLQLFTVRETLKNDYRGTIRAVAEAGYQGIELGNEFDGMTVGEMRRFLDDLNLRAVSIYVGMNAADEALHHVLDNCVALGAVNSGIAWMGEEWRTSEGIRRAARWLESAGKAAAERGLNFIYHAHAFEFETQIDGATMLDTLFALTDPAFVKWQPDSYWIAKGGQDPVAYLKKYSGRVPVCHLKDMTADDARTFEIVGNGCLDFEAIMSAGDAAGVDWYIVEQDHCPKGELASMRESYRNIVSRGWLHGAVE
jgi:sugar phosphate isomerase/epimerase